MAVQLNLEFSFFRNTYSYIRMREYINVHTIFMSTSEKLNRLDFEIHEVGHQERLAVNENVDCY
jgi:predicted patatin/cPLA2 family phospholipase